MVQYSGLPSFVVGDLREIIYSKHLGRLSFDLKMSKIDLSILARRIN